MTDEEAIFAYIDGELEGEERARIEATIDADPALQRMVAEHRALEARLQNAFSTVLEPPIAQLHAVAAVADATVLSLSEERARRDRRSRWGASHWAAMAATLVAGIVGGLAFSGDKTGPVRERNGQLVASADLERALDTQLASRQSRYAPVRIGVTFRSHGGAICRSFAAEATEGVACREGKVWQLKGLLSRDTAQTGEYRLAAGGGTAELVDRLIAGEAMDPAQERAAFAADWKP